MLSGKVAVVTGGSSGIGAATVRLLTQAGARTCIWDIQDPIDPLADDGSATFQKVDVTDTAAIDEASRRIERDLGGIDILVNVAGGGSQFTIEGMTTEDWNRIITLNLSSSFYTMKACVGSMRKRGGGRIVVVSSLAAQRMSLNLGISYTASKSGLLGLVRHAAFEFARDNILVNAVLPGPVATPLMMQKSTQAALDFATKSMPIGRFLTTDEIAQSILFFCLPASSGCTGSSLLVDGGSSIGVVSPDIYFKGRT